MDFKCYIGFSFKDVKPLLEKEGISYDLVEVWDTKKTKLGDDLRIINVKKNDNLIIYVSYF